MDPLSVAASCLAVVSFASKTMSALVSTLYDIERTSRSLEGLAGTLQEIERTLEACQNTVEGRVERSVECPSILSLHSEVFATCQQLSRSWQYMEQKLPKNNMGRRDDTKALAETCIRLIQSWQSSDMSVEPIFWKLQRWTMVSGHHENEDITNY
jgi:hypothetical protein